jgi:hypothetical protein
MTAPGNRTPARLFDNHSKHLDRFGVLLGLTYLTIALASLVNQRDALIPGAQLFGNYAYALLSAVMVLAAGRACGLGRRPQRALDIFLVAVVVLHTLLVTLETFTGVGADRMADKGPAAQAFIWVSPLLLTVLAFFLVMHRVLHHVVVSTGTLLGVITAYLLLALLFYYLFLIADVLPSERFFGVELPTSDFMFFSLSTITTLGYGQPDPHTDLAQLMSSTEAVVGQLFLVTFVALIVGRMVGNSRRTEPDTTPGIDASE